MGCRKGTSEAQWALLSQQESAMLKRHHQHSALHQSTASRRAGLGAGQAEALRTHPLRIMQPNTLCRSLQVNKLKYVMFGMYQYTQMYKSSRTTFVMHVFIPSFLPGDIKILIKSLSNTWVVPSELFVGHLIKVTSIIHTDY